jgi:hypothetical protein
MMLLRRMKNGDVLEGVGRESWVEDVDGGWWTVGVWRVWAMGGVIPGWKGYAGCGCAGAKSKGLSTHHKGGTAEQCSRVLFKGHAT